MPAERIGNAQCAVRLRWRPPVRDGAGGDSARVWHEDSAHQRSWALSMKPDLSAGSSRVSGRRRFWSSDEKRRMIAESLEAGASVSKVAQRHGVNANLLFTWRRQEARAAASGEAESLKLLPVRVADAEAPAAASVAASGPAGRMEIVLGGGERIVVGADVDATALARVVRALARR